MENARIDGSRDGFGAADHDEEYRYHKPSTLWTLPFTARQYARLLVLRSNVTNGAFRYDNELVLRDADPSVVTAMAL